jgi:DNA polymerase-3 subunit delta
MTPQQFLSQIKQQEPAPAYLFLGPEPYQRDFCRRALVERVLTDPEERENGLTRHDLDEVSLDVVVDDACALSLFTARRVLVVSNAEAALPRGKGSEDDAGTKGADASAALARYLKNPSPGVVLVFEAGRYDFQGEDKKKLERVRNFYSAVPAEVEFAHMTPASARQFAEKQVRRAGLALGPAELDQLVEALGAEASRIATEVEKLRLYAAGGSAIGAEQIAKLVPEARDSTIFALVGALGRNDRGESLDVLDTLIRQSEYLPLALSFLATQFRLALAAKEAGLRSAQQIQTHFAKQGMPMWGSRAAQVAETVSKFSKTQLTAALKMVFEADKSLRDTRPDDRVVMEDFILRMTGGPPPSAASGGWA